MRRIAVLLLASLVVVSAATASPRSDNLVSKAVQALGGDSALANVKTVAVKGTIRQWEPEQSVMPGGDMRLVNDSTFDIVVDSRLSISARNTSATPLSPSTRRNGPVTSPPQR